MNEQDGSGAGVLGDEAELRAVLRRRTSEIGALVAGTKLMAKTAALGLPVAVLYAVIGGAVSHTVVELAIAARDADPAKVALWTQITGGVAGFATVYAIVQFAKRDQVTRASWWPALFATPLWLTVIGFMLGQSQQMRQLGPLMLSMFLMAWSLVWMSFAGAAASIVWIRSGRAAMDGRSAGAAEVIDEVRNRTLEVAGPHGARIHAQTIGMQLLLPGIFYALQLAFADMVAVLDPERPALRRSGQLTFGMRGRLFRMIFLVWWPIATVVWLAVAMPFEGAFTSDQIIEKVQELVLDPSAATLSTYVVQELVSTLFVWQLVMALLVLYVEREGQVRAKNALKKLQPAQSAGGAPPG